MITRIISRLYPAVQRNIYFFSKQDPPNNDKKTKNPFYNANKKSKEQDKQIDEESKNNNKRQLFGRKEQQQTSKPETGKRLFGRSNTEDQSHPKDSLFLKSNSNERSRNLFNATPQSSEPSGVKFAKRSQIEERKGLFGSIQKEQENIDEFPEQEQEQEEEEFDSGKDVRLDYSFVFQIPQIQHTNPLLEQRLAEDASRIFSLFEQREWSELTLDVVQYEKLSSVEDVIRYVHPLLMHHDINLYLQWLKHTRISFGDLPKQFASQLITFLLSKKLISEVVKNLRTIKNHSLNIRYSVLDLLFRNVQKKSTSNNIATINLAVTLLQKINSQNISEQTFVLGPWFADLWRMAKYNRKLRDSFIYLFETVVIDYHQNISLFKIHSEGLFLDIVENHYYGSHVSVNKLGALFQHLVKQDYFIQSLQKIRSSMRLYKAKNGLSPFPNATNLVESFEKALGQENYASALLYYVFSLYNGEEELFNTFEKNKAALDQFQFSQFGPILFDGLLSMPLSRLNSNIAERQVLDEQFITSQITQHLENSSAEGDSLLQREDQLLRSYLEKNKEAEVKDSENQDASYETFVQKQLEKEQQESGQFELQNPQWMEFAERAKFLHTAALRLELEQQTNFSRKQLLKILLSSTFTNPLNSVKAAIKLQKPELAYTIFKQLIMRVRIPKRMEKIIEYAVKSYIREHYKIHQEYDSLEAADGLTMKMIEQINLFQGTSANTYLESIYEKLENFDYLLWYAIPDGEMKHQFWETTLIEDRAKQFVEMDISGKINQMAYEKQYEQLNTAKPEQFFDDQNWREEMIYSLGISKTDPTPQDTTRKVWTKYDSLADFHENGLTPMFDQNYVKEQKIRYFGGHTETIQRSAEQYEENQQYAEGQQAAEENIEEAVEQQAQEEVQNLEEQVEEAQEQELVSQAKETDFSPMEESPEGNPAKAAGYYENQQQVEEIADPPRSDHTRYAIAQENQIPSDETPIEQMLPEENIIQYSQRKGVQGYDFNLFLDQAREVYRPIFEHNYQYEKQFKRHMLAMEAIAEAARISDNHSLQKKLNESEETITDPVLIAKLVDHQLWNYDFVTVEDPKEYFQRADIFRQKFFGFKKYQGMKGPLAVPDLSKQKINNFADAVVFRRMTPQIVNELLLKRHEVFLEAEAVVRLEPAHEVQELMAWGVYNDEPLAVYLGEKLAMLTGQTISHPLALAVSKYLSHRGEIPAERIVRCKQSLKIVGRINRQHIYDINKDYEHITIRKQFKKYLEKESERIDNESLAELASVEPTYFSYKNFDQPINRGSYTL